MGTDDPEHAFRSSYRNSIEMNQTLSSTLAVSCLREDDLVHILTYITTKYLKRR